MSPLLRKPFGSHGKVHEITAASAGWRYVGFSLHRLRKGDRVAEATGSNEAILVMVEGKAAFHTPERDWGVLGDRLDQMCFGLRGGFGPMIRERFQGTRAGD